ncbi:MAG TPA: glycosyltransferase family 39 protein [Candidatus Acidoferrum sp.]|nr:glycosyltransferase family 39 protein [Candidatus Acidoferrum sp.]
MQWLQTLDTALFHFVNRSLSNPVFDWLMPIVSGGHGALRWFTIAVVLGFVIAMVRGGARGRICALMLLIVVAAGDPLVIGTIKNAVGRPRPCLALSDVVERLGCSGSGSMPSAHAANWFAAATVLFLFYRRSGWFMFPLAALVAFSRVYCGVHYPADVAAGAILGAGYAICLVILLQTAWNFVGQKFFPCWHQQLPSLINPGPLARQSQSQGFKLPEPESEWLRLGYIVIILELVARWIYLASGLIGLSQDEAYQWLWSKHLALAYFSKPAGIAFLQWAGNHIAGDTELGVRFFSPAITAALSFIVLRFLAREAGARTAFWVLIATLATPLLVAGSVLMTVDPPLVLCWMWAVIAGWRAIQAEGTTRNWLIVGLAMGMGLLFKQSAVYQVLCWAIFFALHPGARSHLRRAGPWMALLIFGLGELPSIIWNSQHDWITVQHLQDNAGLNHSWHPTLAHFMEFIGSETALLNPVFFVAAAWAAVAIWQQRQAKPLGLFLFCMSVPVFLGHALYALHSRILPNWIAPAVPPLFCLAALHWHEKQRLAKRLLVAGLIPGILVSAFMYDTDILGKLVAKLPGDADPSHRVRGWREASQVVEQQRQQFDPNAFIIADRYGTAGLFSFYSAAARTAAKTSAPLVYCVDADLPVNQFYIWPEYHYLDTRHGQNAIFVRHLDPYRIESGWLWKWLGGQEFDYRSIPPPETAPASITGHFETVTNLGRFEIKLKDGRVFQRFDIFGCYHLK